MRWRATYDPRASDPIVIEAGASVYHLGRDEARLLRDQLDWALRQQAEAAPSHSLPAEPATSPGTPVAVKRASSGTLQAVRPRGCPRCGRPRRQREDCDAEYHALGDSQSLGAEAKEAFASALSKLPEAK
jgi:hypothetical protein